MKVHNERTLGNSPKLEFPNEKYFFTVIVVLIVAVFSEVVESLRLEIFKARLSKAMSILISV